MNKMNDIHDIPAQVEALKLEQGDILAIRVGLTAEETGTGVPWIPTPDDLAMIADDVHLVVPEGVPVFIAHLGVNYQVIRDVDSALGIQVESITEKDFRELDNE